MTQLKLARLPDRTPVKLTLVITPELNRALHDYADAYHQTYGETEAVADLIPYMLAAFLDGDRSFARGRQR